MKLRMTLGALALLTTSMAVAQPAEMPRQPPMHGEHGMRPAPAGAPRFAARLRARVEQGLYAGMSDAGRQTLGAAMRGDPADRLAERRAVSAARDRMIAVLEAERLDATALRRAMDEERSAAEATHQRRQAAVLAALQKLSPADRRAFAANSRAMKNRMDDRLRARQDGIGGDAGPPMLFD